MPGRLLAPPFDLMPVYVALFRGIGPTNPNMRNDKLAGALARIGCTRIRPLLASGNLVFESSARSTDRLEQKIERALHEFLGLSLDVFVRERDELARLVQRDPFKGFEHGETWYLTVTFVKGRRDPLCTRLERAKMNSPEFMAQADRTLGKHITTRTWNTVRKILATMDAK